MTIPLHVPPPLALVSVMGTWWHWVGDIGLSDLLDMAVMTLLVYSVLVWMKKTRRAAAVLTGILIIAIVYLAARHFNLLLTAWVLQGFFAVFLIALVVIFQEELRYFFEQIAHWSLNRRLPIGKRPPSQQPRQEVEMLTRVLSDLARDKIGALVVLRGRDLLVRHLDGGEDLDGLASAPILKSIFDPHSAGHDGAVIIDQNRITRFGVHLPLSKNLTALGERGTRHAAALGLAELSDALCLVVSEERGTISAAHRGELFAVSDTQHLIRLLEGFHDEIMPQTATNPWQDFLRKNQREKAMASLMAVVLWVVLVQQARTITRTYIVPVEVATSAATANWTIRQIRPHDINVTLSGPRKDFLFFDQTEVQVRIHAADLQEGDNMVAISQNDLVYPSQLSLDMIAPQQVRVVVTPKTAAQP